MIVRLCEIPELLAPHALHAVGEAMQARVQIGDAMIVTVRGAQFAVERFRTVWRVSLAAEYPVPQPGPVRAPLRAVGS
jgi:hypothetical protein